MAACMKCGNETVSAFELGRYEVEQADPTGMIDVSRIESCKAIAFCTPHGEESTREFAELWSAANGVSLVDAVAKTMMQQIDADDALRACRSFAELHDHCDANLLGGGELLLTWLGPEKATAILNAAQQQIDQWLMERAD